MPETNAVEQTSQAQSETPQSWEGYLETQPEPIRELYTRHSQSLLNSVKATRDERDALARQVKELLPKAEKGSDIEKSLVEISGRLEASERRAAFLEDAMRPEVQCKNAKAAWVLASAQELFDKHGRPDWAAIKAEAPEIFGAATANANAGAGTGTPPPASKSMNDFIRAGRR